MRSCVMGILVMALLAACDLNESGGIRLKYSWTDAEGNDITPPDLTLLHAWGELTYAKETKTAGPAWLGDPDDTLRFENLPYGIAMTLELTIRAAEDPAHKETAPDERPDNVAYYCTSQEFKLVRGKVTEVENACVMTPAAGLDPETGKPTAPALKIYDPDGKELTDKDPTTRHTTVTLCYTALNATKVTIANDAGFEEDVITETIPEATGTAPCPEGYHAHGEWSLGAAPDPKNDRAQRTVFLKASDAQGYETKPASQKVFIDNLAPIIVNQVLDPTSANGASTIVLSLSFHEPVTSVTLDSGGLFSETEQEKVSDQLFKYTHTVTTADDEGDYSFTVTAVDMAGNEADTALADRLAVDKTAPAIETPVVVICDGDDCATEKTKGKAGDLVKVSFTVSETITVPPTVQIAGKDMALCSGADGYEYCYTIAPTGETDGAKPVTVLLTDDAKNTNADDNKLEAMPYFDVTPPQILNSSVSPTAAKNDATVVVSFTFSEPVTDYDFGAGALAFTAADCESDDDQLYLCSYSVAGTEIQNVPYLPAVTCADEAGNECVDYLFKTFEIDYTVPAITVNGCAVTTRRGIAKNGIAAATHDDVVEVTLDMAVEAGITPTVTIGSVMMNDICETPSAGCFAHTVTDADSEGFKLVGIDAVDAAGNPYSTTVDLSGCRAQYDFTGPVLASALLFRLPDYAPARDNATKTLSFSLTDPLTDETVKAQLNLYADEDLDPDTVLITGFDFGDPAGVIDNFAQFEKELNDSVDAGEHTFTVTWRDVLGNEETRPIDWKMFLDKTAPDKALVDMKKVLYTRKPWGTDDTGGKPKFSVAGETGAVDSADIATLIAYNELGSIIGQASVTSGAFDIPTLTGGDLPNIYLNPVKKSGVKASGNGALVTEIKWHATMGGKVPGSTMENPHLFSAYPSFVGPLFQDGSSGGAAADGLGAIGSPPLFSGQGTGVWRQWWQTGNLSARSYHAMAYDSARGKVVLFGGEDALGRDDGTWEWDRTNWSQLTPANKPSARSFHAMAYDSARGKVVLFGGYRDVGGRDDETWEWDGINWAQLAPVNKPSRRYYHAMAYDSARGKVVLFGGYRDAGGRDDETWEWNGSNWTQYTPANKPSARRYHAMAYDSEQGKVVMFGGNDASGNDDETWEWDGTNWVQRIPANKPSARYFHSMAYDSARGKVVLFGGNDASGMDDEIWEWDGINWAQANPANKPSARRTSAMAYDAARGKVVVFGGYDASGYDGEVWDWDGTNWAQRTPANKPSARYLHAMAYDSARGKVVLFGGSDAGGRDDGTWEWDRTNWSQLTPANKPSERHSHGMAYDSARGQVVLFGGEELTGLDDETWEWNGSNWTQYTPANKPSARKDHAMAYDSEQGKVVMFGGNDASGNDDETWEWDGTNWVQRIPANKPSARYFHSMAYDSARGKVVLFGGIDASGSDDETWEWDGTNWTQPMPVNKPSARSNHVMAYDSARGRVFLSGGYDIVGYDDETWEWDGTNWAQRTSANKPFARKHHAMAYDSARGKVVLFGGESAGGNNDETWEWDGGATSRPGQVMQVPFGVAGVSLTPTLKSVFASFYSGGVGYPDYVYMSSPKAWADAKAACENLGTGVHMATIANQTEQMRVASLLTNSWVWLGGSDTAVEGIFAWVDGTPWSYTNWAATQPDDAGGSEHCVQMWLTQSQNRWNDNNCAYGFQYICEYPSSITNGAELKIWDEGMWKTVAINIASPDDLAADPESGKLEWTTTDPLVLNRIFFGDQQTLNFAVTPVAPNGTGTGVIATDYAEVVVRYSIAE